MMNRINGHGLRKHKHGFQFEQTVIGVVLKKAVQQECETNVTVCNPWPLRVGEMLRIVDIATSIGGNSAMSMYMYGDMYSWRSRFFPDWMVLGPNMLISRKIQFAIDYTYLHSLV